MVTHDIAESICMADRIIVLTNRLKDQKHTHDRLPGGSQTPLQRRNHPDFRHISIPYERV